ncbi:MAG: geranylgeranylglyceryl/heptaprenylglyceryl phosphate synthase [Calditrichia bacterium]|nr:geranylgeranylglyceryl/heptaprenylglyceryl phosphate synthase [Calditrichia bacterium]
MQVFDSLLQIPKEKGAGYFVLIDPDKLPVTKISDFMLKARDAGVDAVLIGGSLLISGEFEDFVNQVKINSNGIPVLLFPGGVNQISAKADALLFLSLISGREAQHLIGSQVLAAPIIHRIGIETISTAYMLIESGRPTSAQYMSGTTPIPRNKPDIAVAHALAAQYLGFKFIYLEAGSGAENSVPVELIQAVSKTVDLPLIVGGGIVSPETARKKVDAGASFVVTGTIIENSSEDGLLKKFAEAIHSRSN